MGARESVFAAARATPVGVVSTGDPALEKDQRSALSDVLAALPASD